MGVNGSRMPCPEPPARRACSSADVSRIVSSDPRPFGGRRHRRAAATGGRLRQGQSTTTPSSDVSPRPVGISTIRGGLASSRRCRRRVCQRNGGCRSPSSEVNSSKIAERRPSLIVVFPRRYDSCCRQECRNVTNGLASRDRARVRPVNDNPLPTLLQADARPCTLCHFNAVILQRADHILPSEVCRRRPVVNSNQGLAALRTHRRLAAIAVRCAADCRSLRSPCGERRGPRHGSMTPQHDAAEIERYRAAASVRNAAPMRPAVREMSCPHINRCASYKLAADWPIRR